MEKEETKTGPFEVYKQYLLDKLNNTIALLNEKEEINRKNKPVVIKKYNFFEKHLFKRKEYRAYLSRQAQFEKEQEANSARLEEIEKLLLAEGSPSKSAIKYSIEKAKKATSFKELEVEDTNSAIKELISNGISPRFESYEQALTLAPDYFGNNVDFMKRAVEKNYKLIRFDKTNDERLFRYTISEMINDLEGQSENDYKLKTDIGILRDYIHEIDSPKIVAEGKYKVPHKYMFEEIRNRVASKDQMFLYSKVDGMFDKEFGEELEQLYENPDILLGIHGLNLGSDTLDRENAIFSQGLKNSMQNADADLARTVNFGTNLSFTRALDYRIYMGEQAGTSIIITLPKKALDKKDPVPIWGSNEENGSNNYILPQYIYGKYHGIEDGQNRRIIRNDTKENERTKYKYLKFDQDTTRKNDIIDAESQEIQGDSHEK